MTITTARQLARFPGADQRAGSSFPELHAKAVDGDTPRLPRSDLATDSLAYCPPVRA